METILGLVIIICVALWLICLFSINKKDYNNCKIKKWTDLDKEG